MVKEKGFNSKSLWERFTETFLGKTKFTKSLARHTTIGRILAELPVGWRVWHNVRLDGEFVDHIVASSKGLFCISVINYDDAVIATPQGLILPEESTVNLELIQQLKHQSSKLSSILDAHYVTFPILVSLTPVKGDSSIEGVPILMHGDLLAYLRQQENTYGYSETRGLIKALDVQTRQPNFRK